MTLNELHGWISNPQQLNSETLFKLRELIEKYPYFQTARLLYIQNLALLNSALLQEELQKAALSLPDRRVLFRLLEGDRFLLKPIVKESEPVSSEEDNRTSSLIDTFLSVYKEEKERDSVVPIDLSLDYVSVLKEQEEEEAVMTPSEMKGQHLIDSFIASDDFQLSSNNSLEDNWANLTNEKCAEEEEKEEAAELEEVEDESCFTETLARIYVKQGRYVKALEIIKKLNLKYPEKNSYFADQIRFLEKLIINTKSE
ncbi:MAG: tetratricopeptide repeat protein [Phocaeicola sp.]